MAIHIRKAETTDREAILAISAQVWGGMDYVPKVLDKWMAPELGVLWIAELEGKVAGFSRMTYLDGNRCWLEGIRVDPALRGKGVGKALTNFQIEEAARRGFSSCALSSYYENYESLQIVKTYGFQETGQFKYYEFSLPDEIEQDEAWLEEQSRASIRQKELLSNCNVRQLGLEDLTYVADEVLNGLVLKERHGYLSYDWTFELASESLLEESLAAGDIYLLTKQGETALVSLSAKHAKGSYHTLNFVSNKALEAEAMAFAMTKMREYGETAVSYMTANGDCMAVFKALGFYVFNEEQIDTFVFERKEQEA